MVRHQQDKLKTHLQVQILQVLLQLHVGVISLQEDKTSPSLTPTCNRTSSHIETVMVHHLLRAVIQLT